MASGWASGYGRQAAGGEPALLRAVLPSYTSAMSTLPPQPYVLAPTPQSVVVTDINMTIGAMCRFMVKWVIATIPALIILWLLMLGVGLVFALLFGGLFHHWPNPYSQHF